MAGPGTGSEFQISRTRGGILLGSFTDGAVTWTSAADATVTNASAALVAAGSGVSRYVVIMVPKGATTGIRIAFGATAASSTTYLIEPGVTLYLNTIQAINAIRAGGSDVTVSVITGVPN